MRDSPGGRGAPALAPRASRRAAFARFAARAVATWLLAFVLLGYGAPLVYELDLLAHFRLHLLVLSTMWLAGCLVAGSRAGLWRAAAAAALAAAGLGPLWDKPGAAVEGIPVSVMTANIYFRNPDPVALASALSAADADILLTVETSRDVLGAASGLERLYPHTVFYDAHSVDQKTVLWSKFPVLRHEMFPRERLDLPAGLRAEVEIAPGRTLTVVGLHMSHVSRGVQGYEVESLGALSAGARQPLVVMGDFNATAWSWGVQRAQELTGTRLVGGVARTWRGGYPTPLGTLPEPFGLPIDHVLVSDGIGVADTRTVDLPGSDHEAVRAVLYLPE